MKKRYIPLIAICAILSLLSSCDGTVNEKLFAKDDTQESETPWPDVNLEGWVFAYADKNWNITSKVQLVYDYAEKDGLSYCNNVVRYVSDKKENICLQTSATGKLGGTTHNVIINAPNATIRHYGEAGYVEIQQASSYHLYGKVEDLVVSDGDIVLESNAEVEDFSVAKSAPNNGADLTIKVNNPEKVTVFAYYGASEEGGKEVKVNGEGPSSVFPTKSFVEITSDSQVARIGTQLFEAIPSDTSGVTWLVNKFEADSADDLGNTLAANNTLRVGAGVELTVSADISIAVDGALENFGETIVSKSKNIDVLGILKNYNILNNSGGEVSITGDNFYANINNYGTINNTVIDTVKGKVTVKNKANLNNYGTLSNEAEVTVESGGKLNNYGYIENKKTNTNEGKITNNGTINNKGTFENSGTVDGTINNTGTISGSGSFDPALTD